MGGQLGITTLDDPGRLGLAVTLGGGEVRLLELASAYAVLANGGHALRPVAILRVEDEAGHILLSSPLQPGSSDLRPSLDPRVAYVITNILSDESARIPTFGQDSVLKLSRPAAVKTGTTTDFRDNWTVGYTPDLVVGVWVGNADNEPMREITGVSGAAPIWHDVMEAALKGRPVREFQRPKGLVEVEVCALSGLLPGPDCPHRATELFLPGTEPTQTCTLHQRIALDSSTGLRATADTPPERVVQRVYTVLPPEAQAWAREQGIPEPPPSAGAGSPSAGLVSQVPPQASNLHGPALTMSSPDAGAIYRMDPALPLAAQRIEVSAWPGSDLTLREVTLLVDGRPLARLGSPPYRALWQLEPGLHVFSAEGLAADGKRVTSNEVHVEVRD